METGGQTHFQATKQRIDSSLDILRNELRAIHEQDLSLLRQLMHIHHTITLLSGVKSRRSYSSSCISSPSPVSGSPVRVEKKHPALSRGQSLPFRTDGTEEDEEDEEEEDGDDAEEEDDDDDVADQLSLSTLSFNSNVPDPLGQSGSGDYGDFAMFYPLPYNLQRSPFFPSEKSFDEIPTEDVDVTEDSTNQCPDKAMLRPHDVNNRSTRASSPSTPYELSSSTYLKKSSQIWREVQREQEETGTVDDKKIATLSVFL